MGMLADGTVADPCEAFLQLTNLLYCGQLNKEHKILLGLQVTSFPGKGRQVYEGCLFTCEVDDRNNVR